MSDNTKIFKTFGPPKELADKYFQ